jgi:hypothetical protein
VLVLELCDEVVEEGHLPPSGEVVVVDVEVESCFEVVAVVVLMVVSMHVLFLLLH